MEELAGGRRGHGESRAGSSCCLRPQRRCRSNPNFSEWSSRRRERVFEEERDFQKVKRSLRLLGLELSEFGIPEEGRSGPGARSQRKRRSPSFCTRVADRSVSLDCLRTAVRRAWLEDGLGESHRRLLARAAYEEWYFNKERESWMKREEERRARLRAKMNLREDYQKKKAKSEEEFQKWLSRKRKKEREHGTNVLKKHEERLTTLTKTKEDSEKAFMRWKKNKDKELEKKRTEKRIEEEKKMESEKQKREKKIIAEKAFEQWKCKLDESKRLEDAKRERNKRKLKEEDKRKREEESKLSFQMWKALKDEEIKQKKRKFREAERVAREERLIQIEERTYEAEQAFENWLERVDLRRQKQFYSIDTYHKCVPWIPA